MSSHCLLEVKHKLLVVEGELSISNAVALRRRLLDALQGPLTVDLSGVTHVDGAGLQLLMMLRREARSLGFPLSLVSPSPSVRAAFALVRLTDEFDAHPEPAA